MPYTKMSDLVGFQQAGDFVLTVSARVSVLVSFGCLSIEKESEGKNWSN